MVRQHDSPRVTLGEAEARLLPAAREPTPIAVADQLGDQLRDLVTEIERLSLTAGGVALLAERVGERLAAILGDSCIVLLVDADGQTLTPVASHLQTPEATGLLHRLIEALPLRVATDAPGSAVATRMPIQLVGSALRGVIDSHYWPFLDAAGVRGLLALPMLAGEESVGALVFPRSRVDAPVSPADEALLSGAAARIGFALRQVMLREAAAGDVGGFQGTRSGLRLALDSYPALISCYNTDWRCEFVNADQRRQLAGSSEAVLGKHLSAVLGMEVYEVVAPHVNRVLAGEPQVLTTPTTSDSDEDEVLIIRLIPIGEGPRAAGFTVLITAVPDEQLVPSDLSRREDIAALRASFDYAPIGMAIVALDGRFMRANEELHHITGYSPAELTKLKLEDITHPDDLDVEALQTERLIVGEIDSYELEKRYYDPNGHTIWVEMSRSLVRTKQGQPLYFIVYLEDISVRKREEERLRHLAERDSLTGLLNRRRFEEELNRYEQMAMRYGDITGVLMIDMDDLKTINDTRGHSGGDDVIKQVAQAIANRLRMTDIVARIGGDEFAALLPHTSRMHVAKVGAELCEMIKARCAASISVGAAMIDGDNPGGALDRADRAMYLVKEAGGNGVQVDGSSEQASQYRRDGVDN